MKIFYIHHFFGQFDRLLLCYKFSRTEQPVGLKQPDTILESFKIYNPSLPVEIGRLPDYQGVISREIVWLPERPLFYY